MGRGGKLLKPSHQAQIISYCSICGACPPPPQNIAWPMWSVTLAFQTVVIAGQKLFLWLWPFPRSLLFFTFPAHAPPSYPSAEIVPTGNIHDVHMQAVHAPGLYIAAYRPCTGYVPTSRQSVIPASARQHCRRLGTGLGTGTGISTCDHIPRHHASDQTPRRQT